MLIKPRYLRRYRQIVSILFDYGFGAALNQLGMGERFNIPRACASAKWRLMIPSATPGACAWRLKSLDRRLSRAGRSSLLAQTCSRLSLSKS